MQTNLNADMVDGIHGNQIILKTTTNLTYYVNATGGSDSNDGLSSGTSFKTIGYAISKLPQVINHTVIINVANSTYAETISLNGYVGLGSIAIQGGLNLSESATHSINAISVVECMIKVSITGFTATTTGHAFSSYFNMYVSFYYCSVNAASSNYGFVASNGGNTYIFNSVVSNRGCGIF